MLKEFQERPINAKAILFNFCAMQGKKSNGFRVKSHRIKSTLLPITIIEIIIYDSQCIRLNTIKRC